MANRVELADYLGGAITPDNPLPVDSSAGTATNAVLGSTTGAAVITDDDGTIQQYLRGLIAYNVAFAADDTPVEVSTRFAAAPASSSFTRDANVTPYTINDAVSDDATAGNVTPLAFTMAEDDDLPLSLRGMLIDTNDTGPGAATAIFRAWIYQSDPTASSGVVTGDNVAFSAKKAGFIGFMEGSMRAFSDGSRAHLAPVFTPSSGLVTPTEIISPPTIGGRTFYALLQTLTAWTPSANSTVFTATLEGYQGRA